MEQYIYVCPKCGFVHMIPAYWASFEPEREMCLPHVNMNTGEDCNETLLLKEE